MDAEPLILDELMPRYDVTITAHRIIDGRPAAVCEAARNLDFAAVHSPLVDLAFWLRGLPARLLGRPRPAPPRVRLTGDSGDGLPGWLILGERPGREIAFGAVGVFWRGVIQWRLITADEFAGFTEPGFGKIACNFSVRPYGSKRTLLSYECRVALTDERSRRGFRRYWTVIRPVIAHLTPAVPAQIAADVRTQAVPSVAAAR